jgi:hypothetical protein
MDRTVLAVDTQLVTITLERIEPMSIPRDVITRLAPLVGAVMLVVSADRVGDAGPLGVAAAAAIIFGGVAAAGWKGRN